MSQKYDVIVIGSGPGGYVCAIRAAQLGLKVAVVEKYSTFGGTCLNVGCIPSKALLDSSEHYYLARTSFKEHGIEIKDLSVNWKTMLERKRSVVSMTTQGIAGLFKKNKIDSFQGTGSFVSSNKVKISGEKGAQEIEGKNIVIATGSKPSTLPSLPLDKKYLITSTEALELPEIPKHLIIVGGGVIGLELGSVYIRLGSKVTVVEFLPTIVASMDQDCSKFLLRSLKAMGMEFHLSTKVTGVELPKTGKSDVKVFAEDSEGKKIELQGDKVLVSVGRRPNTEGLDLSKIGLKPDEKGRIPVNAHLQTTIPNIYAIGDVIQGPMLAHKAEEEGVAVAEMIAGQKPHLNPLTIPAVVYTAPEVASVGYSEQELKKQNRPYKSGVFPFKASGRARAFNDTDGMVKVLADKNTDEILGVHMVGPRASDMIAEAVVAMEYRASAEDIGRIVHAHPTFTEAFKEAALAASENRPIHI